MPRSILSPLLVSLVLASAFASACRVGEASFDSTLEGRGFDPSGTVFSTFDERDETLDLDQNPRVVVAMTWVIFDPRSDLNDLEGSDLADLTHELELRDALALVFERLSDVETGATFTSTSVGGREPGTGPLSVRLHLAPEQLHAGSTYADLAPLASARTTTVTITDESLGSDDARVAGEVTIKFERQEGDVGTAVEGELSGRFVAPFVGERIAEHNLALLDVEDTLGLPLGPRVAVESP